MLKFSLKWIIYEKLHITIPEKWAGFFVEFVASQQPNKTSQNKLA